MIVLSPWLSVLAAGLLLWAGARIARRGRTARRAGFVQTNPAYRHFLDSVGLRAPADFLRLDGVVVSGHSDRNVTRVILGHGSSSLRAYLKREHRIGWRVRLTSVLAGCGFVSRSLREARTLQALDRDGGGGPDWLAVGEDGTGRAFLLLRAIPDAVDLRAYLLNQDNRGQRRRVARSVGTAVARLHGNGLDHPDLYAGHVLVDPHDAAIAFLDWQRARRGGVLGWGRRAAALGALHATLSDDLVTPRERLVCLLAYLRECRRGADPTATNAPHPVEPEGSLRRWLASPGVRPPQSFFSPLAHILGRLDARRAARRVEVEAARLLRRRHVREKRQPPLGPDTQSWVCLDGESLCVNPGWKGVEASSAREWLGLDRQPAGEPRGAVTRRWVSLRGGLRTLLVRRRTRTSVWARLFAWLRTRPLHSPEQREAALLLRLQRHAVAAPRVLAMGQRRGPDVIESFLLVEPAADTVRLDTWLARHNARADAAMRRPVLWEAGTLLRRLHAASCYLSGAEVCPLRVQPRPGRPPAVVLGCAEGVESQRRARPRRVRRDRQTVQRLLRKAGCTRTDLEAFAAGYDGRVQRAQARRADRPGSVLTTKTTALATRIASPPRTTSPPTPHVERPPMPATAPVTSTLWQRWTRGVRRLRHRPDWASFAGDDWPDRIMEMAVTDRFHAKQGRSVGRLMLTADGGAGQPARRLTVYLKRHHRLPWWDRLLALLWPGGNWSPALQEWEHLEWARRQGVPVPEAAAAGEFIGPGPRLRSFLAVEELTDMLPLHEAVPMAAARLEPATFRRWKRGLVAEMARIARMLHDRRCFHKDLYLCHFYIRRQDTTEVPSWRGQVFLIDLHRLARHRWTWLLWQVKDLAQLLYSSEVVGVDARDRLEFWRVYRELGPRRWSEGWLRWGIVFKWLRYRRHNARRRA